MAAVAVGIAVGVALDLNCGGGRGQFGVVSNLPTLLFVNFMSDSTSMWAASCLKSTEVFSHSTTSEALSDSECMRQKVHGGYWW